MYSLEPSSFRDPSGFLFYHDDVLYRQINQSYKDEYESSDDLWPLRGTGKLKVTHTASTIR